MLDRILRFFAYDDWANREVISSLERLEDAPPRALRFMAHVVATEWLWMSRLKRDGKSVVVWPEWTLGQCRAQMNSIKAAWQSYLGNLNEQRLADKIGYTNTVGESWTNCVEDILLHVTMHSAYHRGQIAADVRVAGHEPAYTDFIHAIRQGFVE